MGRVIRNLEEILGAALLVALLLVAVLRILSRYAHLAGEGWVTRGLAGAGSWSVEVCTYLFIWMVFIGAALALKKRQHFAVEALTERLPERLRAWIAVLVGLLVLLFAGLLTFYGTIQTVEGWGVTTPATEIPKSIPYAAVPCGGLLMILRALQQLRSSVDALRGDEATREEGP